MRMRPSFLRETYNATIPQDVAVPMEIVTVSASDADTVVSFSPA